jgi:hypothetical protein
MLTDASTRMHNRIWLAVLAPSRFIQLSKNDLPRNSCAGQHFTAQHVTDARAIGAILVLGCSNSAANGRMKLRWDQGKNVGGYPVRRRDGGQQSQSVTTAVAAACRLLFESPVLPSSTQLTVAFGVTRYQPESCACFGGPQGDLFDATLDAR